MSWRLSLLFLLVTAVAWAQFGQGQVEVPGSATAAAQDDPFGAGVSEPNPFGGGGEEPSGDDPFGRQVEPGDDPFADTPPNPFKKKAAAKPAVTKPAQKTKAKPAPKRPAKPIVKSAVERPPALVRLVRPTDAPERAFPSLTVESKMQRAARARIEQALSSDTAFEYLEETLKDVVEDIAYRHEIPIVIDTAALDDFGIDTEMPISMSLKGVSLRSALTLVLKEIDLTFLISEEVLHITTPESAESRIVTRFYQVKDLLPNSPGGYGSGGPYGAAAPSSRGDVIVKLIKSLVEHDTWDDVGGPGAIQFIDHLDALAISQTDDVLVKIDCLLATLQEITQKPPKYPHTRRDIRNGLE